MADKQISTELKVGVTGRDSITGLADDLDDVAKVLTGDLSKSAQGAAARLRELADQDAAISAFLRLQNEARDAGRALKAAENEAANYGKQITAMGPPTAQEAAMQQRLQAAVDSARTAVAQENEALAKAQATLQQFGISGQNARDAQLRLRQEVAAVRDAVQDLVPAHQNAAAGAANAGASMVRTHRQIGDGVESISKQLARLQSLYAALQGLQGFKSMAMDLAETADQANNLQSRIKLVTGEGDNFKKSWEGVQEVALRTHSALEETGTLFMRLAQAGKDAGLSTAQASAQSLALTETIGQAIQLSGASAQASSAAITQLVQGLQGGALRGDEFNSVMEQSPRLARALADGLGVTTGELRKMADAGLLTSDTVIKALQGQSQVLADEFSKLPPTVGRALQDLSTQWTLYVAETDKATGASTAAATAINALSNNLRTIAGLLIDAGQATAAFVALRLAQHFLGIGTAAQGAAAAVAASNAQMVAAGTAGATAAASASRFATILAGLRTFTLVGLIANFKDIGTWIGESAAKLAGYKDRTEELARAEKLQAEIAKEAAADRARLAASIQAVIDKQFELSKAGRAAVAEFDVLTKSGTSAADAIKKITENFDLSKVQGIKDFTTTLDKLAADGKVTAGEFRAAWAQALNGKDLAQFEVTARIAFGATSDAAKKAADEVQKALAAGITGKPLEELQAKAAAALGAVGRDSERLAQITDAVLREAVRRTGLEYEQLQDRIGSVSRSAINDTEAIIASLGKLQADGVNTARVLAASFTKAINTADSQEAIDVLKTRIEAMRKVLGDKITDGLLDQLKDQIEKMNTELEKATPGIDNLREALKKLGIESEESLKKAADSTREAYEVIRNSGAASVRELQEGFKKAAEAAIAANKGVAPAWVEAEAAVRGYQVVTDAAGKSTLQLAGTLRSAKGDVSAHAAAVRDLAAAYSDVEAKALAAQGQILAAAQAQKNADTANSSITKTQGKTNDISGLVPKFENREQAEEWLQQYDEEYRRLNIGGNSSVIGNYMREMTMAQYRSQVESLDKRRALDDAKKRGDERVKEEEAGAKKGNGTTAAPAPTPAPAPVSPSHGAGMKAGDTYLANITIEGKTRQVKFADQASLSTTEQLLRDLANGKGVY